MINFSIVEGEWENSIGVIDILKKGMWEKLKKKVSSEEIRLLTNWHFACEQIINK